MGGKAKQTFGAAPAGGRVAGNEMVIQEEGLYRQASTKDVEIDAADRTNALVTPT